MDFLQVKQLMAADMEAVNQTIYRHLDSNVPLVKQMGHYIINSGGKRLRPLLALLSARACGYRGEQHANVAAIIEFIHTATLLHDDVVDDSDLRRGHDTANSIWGNESSVLVGDFIFSRSFEMMVEVGEMRVMEVLAHASNTIAEGEVMQLLNRHNPDTSEEDYMRVIEYKTAKLFEAACRLGAVLGKQSSLIEAACAGYGLHLGLAFQLVDDIMDYRSTSAVMGKNLGDDFAEGKPTLPLIYALKEINGTQKQQLRLAVELGGREHLALAIKAIETTGAINYTETAAKEHAGKAINHLQHLPESDFKHAMAALAEFATNRVS